MAIHISYSVSHGMARCKKAIFTCCLVLTMFLIFPLSAFCSEELLINSSEYKDKDFQKGCISDYSDLVKGDNVDWIWTSRGTKLAGHKVNINKFVNKSDELRSSQVEEIRSIIKEFIDKLKGDKGTLSADMCIYEVQKFSAGKAWIPFVGGHQMQAGIGVELNVKDRGKLVAKIRHFARQGSRPEDAAQEVAEDLKKYFAGH